MDNKSQISQIERDIKILIDQMASGMEPEQIKRIGDHVCRPGNVERVILQAMFLDSIGDNGFGEWSRRNLHKSSAAYVVERGLSEAFDKFCAEHDREVAE